jgi:hypothetical protein
LIEDHAIKVRILASQPPHSPYIPLVIQRFSFFAF